MTEQSMARLDSADMPLSPAWKIGRTASQEPPRSALIGPWQADGGVAQGGGPASTSRGVGEATSPLLMPATRVDKWGGVDTRGPAGVDALMNARATPPAGGANKWRDEEREVKPNGTRWNAGMEDTAAQRARLAPDPRADRLGWGADTGLGRGRGRGGEDRWGPTPKEWATTLPGMSPETLAERRVDRWDNGTPGATPPPYGGHADRWRAGAGPVAPPLPGDKERRGFAVGRGKPLGAPLGTGGVPGAPGATPGRWGSAASEDSASGAGAGSHRGLRYTVDQLKALGEQLVMEAHVSGAPLPMPAGATLPDHTDVRSYEADGAQRLLYPEQSHPPQQPDNTERRPLELLRPSQAPHQPSPHSSWGPGELSQALNSINLSDATNNPSHNNPNGPAQHGGMPGAGGHQHPTVPPGLAAPGAPPLVAVFSAAAHAADQWVYRDPQGVVQGPFSKLDIVEWQSAGYFTDDLPVRSSVDADPSTWWPLAAVKEAWFDWERKLRGPPVPMGPPGVGPAAGLLGPGPLGDHQQQQMHAQHMQQAAAAAAAGWHGGAAGQVPPLYGGGFAGHDGPGGLEHHHMGHPGAGGPLMHAGSGHLPDNLGTGIRQGWLGMGGPGLGGLLAGQYPGGGPGGMLGGGGAPAGQQQQGGGAPHMQQQQQGPADGGMLHQHGSGGQMADSAWGGQQQAQHAQHGLQGPALHSGDWQGPVDAPTLNAWMRPERMASGALPAVQQGGQGQGQPGAGAWDASGTSPQDGFLPAHSLPPPPAQPPQPPSRQPSAAEPAPPQPAPPQQAQHAPKQVGAAAAAAAAQEQQQQLDREREQHDVTASLTRVAPWAGAKGAVPVKTLRQIQEEEAAAAAAAARAAAEAAAAAEPAPSPASTVPGSAWARPAAGAPPASAWGAAAAAMSLDDDTSAPAAAVPPPPPPPPRATKAAAGGTGAGTAAAGAAQPPASPVAPLIMGTGPGPRQPTLADIFEKKLNPAAPTGPAPAWGGAALRPPAGVPNLRDVMWEECAADLEGGALDEDLSDILPPPPPAQQQQQQTPRGAGGAGGGNTARGGGGGVWNAPPPPPAASAGDDELFWEYAPAPQQAPPPPPPPQPKNAAAAAAAPTTMAARLQAAGGSGAGVKQAGGAWAAAAAPAKPAPTAWNAAAAAAATTPVAPAKLGGVVGGAAAAKPKAAGGAGGAAAAAQALATPPSTPSTTTAAALSPEFWAWCRSAWAQFGNTDVSLLEWLTTLNCRSEIADYINQIIGDQPGAGAFVAEFLRRKEAEVAKAANPAKKKKGAAAGAAAGGDWQAAVKAPTPAAPGGGKKGGKGGAAGGGKPTRANGFAVLGLQ